MLKKSIIISIIILVFLSGCSQQQSPVTQKQEAKYVSTLGNFEFQKPIGWKTTECKEDCKTDEPLLKLSKEETSINFFIHEGESNIEQILAEFKSNLQKIPGANFQIVLEDEIRISDEKAKHFILETIVEKDDSKATQEIIFLEKNNKLYVISSTYKAQNPEIKREFSTILDTFKINS